MPVDGGGAATNGSQPETEPRRLQLASCAQLPGQHGVTSSPSLLPPTFFSTLPLRAHGQHLHGRWLHRHQHQCQALRGARTKVLVQYERVPEPASDREHWAAGGEPGNALQLLDALRAAPGPSRLKQLVQDYGGLMDAGHVTAALSRLPQVVYVGGGGRGVRPPFL
jgi:hypothetical protein